MLLSRFFATTSLWEGRANLSAFRTFVRLALVWFCLFPLCLGVWEGLRFVIVALPGLLPFVYLLNQRKAIMSFDLQVFIAAHSQELLNLAKKSDLLDIAAHYE